MNAYNQGIVAFCGGDNIITIASDTAKSFSPFINEELFLQWIQGQQDACVQLTVIPPGYALLVTDSPVREGDMYLNLSRVNNMAMPWCPVDKEDINVRVAKFAAIIRKGL
jgi:hypothetical protein